MYKLSVNKARVRKITGNDPENSRSFDLHIEFCEFAIVISNTTVTQGNPILFIHVIQL